ncbi:hypothetical protein M3N64_12875 [Sporolactobacillus sp. CPB3-1]|uniref:Uncharacterized protein n=1 Tax=Sporolactobacillus mangiferae TaxID=2940498 RepID=A0ABT0MDR1_9BACL|nr:hypothetical protein [Sporolactobacillus mangiferae]MCL1632813.1 hypothetical protein [Sporolactobacillus mangiferae]
MAFDQLSLENQFSAISWLAARSVQRILTHVDPMGHSITHELNHLCKLIRHADNRLIILLGHHDRERCLRYSAAVRS